MYITDEHVFDTLIIKASHDIIASEGVDDPPGHDDTYFSVRRRALRLNDLQSWHITFLCRSSVQ